MFHWSELLPLTCLFLAAETTTGQILQPQNLSLLWINDSTPEVSWEPPPHLTGCKYELLITTSADDEEIEVNYLDTSYHHEVFMQGGFLQFSLTTVCDVNRSEPAVLEIRYPELVKMLDCYSYTATQTHCSWSPTSNATDLRFFYWLGTHYSDETPTKKLQECSSYTYTGDVKTGCNLQATQKTFIEMLFNATLNNTLVRNTFRHERFRVKPPPPTWTVIKSKDKLNISWIPPDMLRLDLWTFLIKYTACDSKKEINISEVTLYMLERVSRCRYCISIEAKSKHGNSPPSDQKCFDADRDLSSLVYAVVPGLMVIVALVILVCCRRNKDIIFPKVPEPRDFLTDITNNKSSFCKLYNPAEEEKNCKLTLLTDTQASKPYSQIH
ncbi:hypothetical protein ATANTOWER_026279 [Ataeniobius toweri]|uniref:Fibronectin type-III domain-containing protein n=1 Tax=Ataeniobius toweri TaxID=208326 RepID=A0ABU7CCJ3_9TELE|nr:hypothetical protein [Ataeniobius toweri]